MFENIIGQSGVVDHLSEEIQKQKLPHSLLFYGDQYSGKLTTALELSRVLTCEEGSAAWDCTCRQCNVQRLLTHQSTIMLGSRYFSNEITASADVLKRTEKRFARYLLVRAVRKLTRRFDDFLWEGNENKIKKVYGIVQELESNIAEIEPNQNNTLKKETVENIVSLSKEIASSVNLETIPIDLIRKVSYWAHTTAGDTKKIIIIENAQKMLESARNALLKILEEPPANVYFVLIAPRKGALISTILSRLRHYYFVGRDQKSSGEVLKKIFREDPQNYPALRDYFLAWSEQSRDLVSAQAKQFMKLLLERERTLTVDRSLAEICDQLKNKSRSELLLEELLMVIRAMVKEQLPTSEETSVLLAVAEKWKQLIADTYQQIDLYNQNPSFAIESLFYKMQVSI